MADVQIKAWCLGLRVRRVGHRVTAAVAVTQQKLHILTGVVLKNFAGRQLQAQCHDVVRQALQAGHAHRHFFNLKSVFFRYLTRLQHQVAVRHGAAGQHKTGGLFLVRQGLGLVRAVGHAAFELFAFARTAGAVFATVGHADTLADGRGQHGLVRVDAETAAAGLHGDLKTHLVILGVLGRGSNR